MTTQDLNEFELDDDELLPIVKLWCFRMLVLSSAQIEFIQKYGFSDDDLAIKLELGHLINNDLEEKTISTLRHGLRNHYRLIEKNYASSILPIMISKNIQRLANMINLNEVEKRIFEFFIMFNREESLQQVANYSRFKTAKKITTLLSQVLDISKLKINEALSSSSALVQSGLILFKVNENERLSTKFKLISPLLSENIHIGNIQLHDFIKDIVYETNPPILSLDNYSHIEQTTNLLHAYLKNAISSKRKGVNILIHGTPGTGKSQLAKVIAKNLNCPLFEISSEDKDNDPFSGIQRLRAFNVAQRFFSRNDSLILFDEVEDVFNGPLKGKTSKDDECLSKAWLNKILEENLVPAIWISNCIDIDPAYIRRFDMVFELPIPPRKQREKLLRDYCGDMVDEVSLQCLSKSEHLSPAVVARTASVTQLIGSDLGEAAVAPAFTLLINNTLQAQGHKKIADVKSNKISVIYNPDFICANVNLDEIAHGLISSKSGRFCLYGPPGTGKTAYGHWLAEKLDMPIITKTVSELISKWVGETEKNIARAFDEAKESNSLLIIDEVDSFLQDRRGARQNWEITAVNEMLTQMENYDGIFIASTNLMKDLDQAALRRFDLKVEFTFLSKEKLKNLFLVYCQNFHLDPPSESTIKKLSHVNNCTPGDFSTIARQQKFKPIINSDDLLDSLINECKIKDRANYIKIGFID